MQRPGLKRLLDDIAAGKVDVILVYKIDRLTRSLAVFAKGARGCPFFMGAPQSPPRTFDGIGTAPGAA